MLRIEMLPSPVRSPQHRWAKPALELFGAGLVLFLLFITYGILPNRWYHILYVYSGSMSPAIQPGDLILITPPPAELTPGMIVTLKIGQNLVTHRLIEIRTDGHFTTQGDANNVADDWNSTQPAVVGLYQARIPYLGYVIAAFQDLLKGNASGAWFVDRESIQVQIGDGKPDAGTSIEVSLGTVGEVNNGHQSQPIFAVRGEICIKNTGDQPTQNLKILDQVEYKDKSGNYQAIQDAVFEMTPDKQLQPKEMVCFPYRIEFDRGSAVSFRNTALVTITNHSGWLPGSKNCPGTSICPFGPTVKVEFIFNVDSIVQPTATPTPTAVPIGKIAPTPTPTHTALPSATMTPAATPANTELPTSTIAPTATQNHTEVPTSIPINTVFPTATPTHTEVPTPTPTPTEFPTNSPAPTELPTATPTHTPVPTATPTHTVAPTVTPTHTPLPTEVPTATMTPTVNP